MPAAVPEGAFDTDEILAGLERWVRIDSATFDRDGVNRMMDVASEAAGAMGAEIERHPGRDGYADAVVARMRAGRDEPGILVLTHLDTVHPRGSFPSERVFARDGDRLFGPAILDMKGGTFLALYALRLTFEHTIEPPLPVTFMFVPDEEVGSPTSRELIEAEAARSRYVLVPEPAQDGADLITGRWAFQRFVVRARGRPAHAGATLASGRSAIREIAEQIVAIEEMSELGAQRHLLGRGRRVAARSSTSSRPTARPRSSW